MPERDDEIPIQVKGKMKGMEAIVGSHVINKPFVLDLDINSASFG